MPSNMELTINHAQALSRADAEGEAFRAALHPAANGMATQRMGTSSDSAAYSFERVLQIAIADAALKGDPDYQPSESLLNSLQLAMAWDRTIVAIEASVAKSYRGCGLPSLHDLNRLALLPGAAYFAIPWVLDGHEFHGLWVIRDQHPETLVPYIRMRLVGGSEVHPAAAEICFPLVASWEEALRLSWADIARTLATATGPQAAEAMNRHIASASRWEPLLALIYSLSDYERVRQREEMKRKASPNDLGVVTLTPWIPEA